jgi:hypothetical protein
VAVNHANEVLAEDVPQGFYLVHGSAIAYPGAFLLVQRHRPLGVPAVHEGKKIDAVTQWRQVAGVSEIVSGEQRQVCE